MKKKTNEKITREGLSVTLSTLRKIIEKYPHLNSKEKNAIYDVVLLVGRLLTTEYC